MVDLLSIFKNTFRFYIVFDIKVDKPTMPEFNQLFYLFEITTTYHFNLVRRCKNNFLNQELFKDNNDSSFPDLSGASIFVLRSFPIVPAIVKRICGLEDSVVEQPHDADLLLDVVVVRRSHQHLPHDHAALRRGEEVAGDFIDEPVCWVKQFRVLVKI